jgi:putative oxidoreductase
MSATAPTLSNRPVSGAITLVGRLIFAFIFVTSGPHHFMSQTIAYAASQGVPMASIAVPFSGLLALLGGLSIVLGYHARIGGWLIALFLVCITPMMHNFWAVSDPMAHQMQMIMFMKNLSMLGGALLITQFGSGPWSLDGGK